MTKFHIDCFDFQHSEDIPDFVTTAIPVICCKDDFLKPKLQNNFAMAMLDLPINIGVNSMLQRLTAIKKQTSMLKKSNDIEVYYLKTFNSHFYSFIYLQINYLLVNKLSELFPHIALKHGLKANNLTLTISNVPGLPQISMMNGSKILDVVFFTPHRGNTGACRKILVNKQ